MKAILFASPMSSICAKIAPWLFFHTARQAGFRNDRASTGIKPYQAVSFGNRQNLG
jgi:hypothetical protein